MQRIHLPIISLCALLLLPACSKQSEQKQSASLPGSHNAADSSQSGAPLSVDQKEWPDTLAPRPDGIPRSIQWDFFSKESHYVFTQRELDVLARDGFYLREKEPPESIETDDMVELYKRLYVTGFGQSYSTVPVFITSDLLLHIFHVVVDRMNQDIEETKLLPVLATLTSNLLQQSKAELNSSLPDALREAAQGNVGYFSVAARLLGDSTAVPPVMQQEVEQELSLIFKAHGFGESPLFRSTEDYSQYKPRGHYTVNENLSRYFRAMMWYGRRSFSTTSEQLTLQAILMTQLLSRPENKLLWERIEKPTEFIAGHSDDLNMQDYAELLTSTFGSQQGYADLTNAGNLRKFQEAATKRSAPLISGNKLSNRQDPSSIERGFRFMGQRTVPDAVIFNDLTSPRVGDDASPRNMPTVLDVMAVLGSPAAMESDRTFARIPGFMDGLQRLKSEFDGYDEPHWTQNLYWCWLHTLRPLIQEKGNTFPPFMRGRKWAGKGLLTAAASWTELKHDTILLSKQSYAEMGEGEDEEVPKPPPQPKSYVEPDMDFFNRLVFMVHRTREEFASMALLPDEYRQKLDEFSSSLEKLRGIVRKELEQRPVSDEEYTSLLTFAGDISEIILPWKHGDIIEDKFKQMALVADVHTDAFGERVLEEAVGSPQEIYVAVRDSSGGTRVCVGYTFTHYEFTRPMSERMTDDEWKQLIYPHVQPTARASEAAWSRNLRISGGK